MKRVMTIYGTRPEAIKVAPIIKALESDMRFESIPAVTGQHREMLDQVNDLFGIEPHHDLHLMRPGAGLADLSSRTLTATTALLEAERPDAVIVQGDTSTAFVCALASFYEHIPVVHVEAGLRTWNLQSPFPEEANRQLVSRLAALHLAPTATSRANLRSEGVPDRIIAVTGNTVIDALLGAVAVPANFDDVAIEGVLKSRTPYVLVTAHRRESWGGPMRGAMRAVRQVAEAHPEVNWLLPMHRNPVVRAEVEPILGALDNVILCEPLTYHEFAHAMRECLFVLTDSGGVQEEAPSLGKPVLVMRDNTERPEAVEAGTVELIGTEPARVAGALTTMIEDHKAFARMARAVNPYGDGSAGARSIAALAHHFGIGDRLPDFAAPASETFTLLETEVY